MLIKQIASPYTPEQVVQYLQAIRFPSVPSPNDLSSIKPTLDTLSQIVRLHIITFPFENLAMHYTKEHAVDISPKGVFERMVVTNRGFGSYCFGQNTLLKGILRGLSFRVYSGAGRANTAPADDFRSPKLSTFFHMILFVLTESSDQIYLADVGFGGTYGLSGLVRPVPLIANEIFEGSAPPEQQRLIRAAHPCSSLEHTDTEVPKLDWILQCRCGTTEWRTLYHFTTDEFYHEDYEASSFALYMNPVGTFASLVICVKVFEVGDDSLGRYTLRNGRLMKRIGTKSEVVKIVTSEEERIQVLRKFCGVMLEDGDVEFVRATGAALHLNN